MVRALACRHVPVVLLDPILGKAVARQLAHCALHLIRVLYHILARPVPQDLSAPAGRHLPPLASQGILILLD